MVALIKYYMTFAFDSAPAIKLTSVKRGQLLARSRRIRRQRGLLGDRAFLQRKRFLLQDMSAFGKSDAAAEAETEAEGSPLDMISAMGSNSAMMARNVFHIIEMTWVSSFFSGFVVARLPFPLTDRFKSMLHRGLSTSLLPNVYVSSLSWFVLTMFGIRGLVNIALSASETVANDIYAMDPTMAAMSSGMGMASSNPFGGADSKAFIQAAKTERSELEIQKSHPILALAQASLLEKINERYAS